MQRTIRFLSLVLTTSASILLTACTQGGERVSVYQYSALDIKKASLGYHTIQSNDTLGSVAQTYQVDLQDLLDINDLNPPYKLESGARLKIPAPVFYTVQPKDTIYRISKIFDRTVSEIIKVNKLSPPYKLKAGDVLQVTHEGLQKGLKEDRAVSAPRIEVAYKIGESSRKSDVVIREDLPPLSDQNRTNLHGASNTQVAQQMPNQPKLTNVSLKGDKPERSVFVNNKQVKPTVGEYQEVSMPSLSSAGFLTPVTGRVISSYGPKSDGLHNDGINIAAARGTPIRAAENGIVVYSGSEIEGFGYLILIRHEGNYITAYAHMDKMLAEKGDLIKRGQTIGTVGSSGHVRQPQLHFEIRKGKKTVNPGSLIRI